MSTERNAPGQENIVLTKLKELSQAFTDGPKKNDEHITMLIKMKTPIFNDKILSTDEKARLEWELEHSFTATFRGALPEDSKFDDKMSRDKAIVAKWINFYEEAQTRFQPAAVKTGSNPVPHSKALDTSTNKALEKPTASKQVEPSVAQPAREAPATVKLNSAPSAHNETPEVHDFFKLIREGNIQELTKMLDAKPELLTLSNGSNRLPIHTASFSGKVDVIHLLKSRGADLEAIADDGENPLAKAARSNQSEAIKALLDYGVNIDLILNTQAGYESPVYIAARCLNVDAVKTLVARGAHILPLKCPSHLALKTYNLFAWAERHHEKGFEKIFGDYLNICPKLDFSGINFSDNSFEVLLKIISTSEMLTTLHISAITVNGLAPTTSHITSLKESLSANRTITTLTTNNYDLKAQTSTYRNRTELKEKLNLDKLNLNEQKLNALYERHTQLNLVKRLDDGKMKVAHLHRILKEYDPSEWENGLKDPTQEFISNLGAALHDGIDAFVANLDFNTIIDAMVESIDSTTISLGTMGNVEY